MKASFSDLLSLALSNMLLFIPCCGAETATAIYWHLNLF